MHRRHRRIDRKHDRHAIPPLDAESAQHVRQRIRLRLEHSVGDSLDPIVVLDEKGNFGRIGRGVTIADIVGNIVELGNLQAVRGADFLIGLRRLDRHTGSSHFRSDDPGSPRADRQARRPVPPY